MNVEIHDDIVASLNEIGHFEITAVVNDVVRDYIKRNPKEILSVARTTVKALDYALARPDQTPFTTAQVVDRVSEIKTPFHELPPNLRKRLGMRFARYSQRMAQHAAIGTPIVEKTDAKIGGLLLYRVVIKT